MNPEELQRIAMLESLDHETLSRLASAVDQLECADGQVIFAEGDPGNAMYFILDGRVRIEKRTGGTVQKTLTVLEPGDYFGEMALLDQKPRSAAAVASGDARIVRLSKTAFDQLQDRGGAVATSVLFAMIRTSGERIRRLSTHLVVYDEVGKAIGEAPDLATLLEVIVQQLSTAFMADWGMLLLRPQFSDHLEVRAQFNLMLSPAQRAAIGNGEGFLVPLLQHPRHQLIDAFDEEERFKSCGRLGFETASLLLSPIAVEAQFLGLILIGGKERAQFDLDALNLTRGVARQAAQAILNARHREEEEARSRHSRQFVRF